jgi:beta-glucosidase
MNIHEKAVELVAQMTLKEKATLGSGKDFWYLKGIERLGLPEIMVTDGPHGLRKQLNASDHLGLNQSVPAVCFPTAAATACSFDRDLLREIGKAIAEECRQEEVAVVLGPGMNIKRSPLCGRNFEYFSEDPLLTGEMAAAFIDGVQNQNVGVSIKHFAVNNQEKRRMVGESVLDERTFREIYLKGFEIAIKKSKPWTVMCSYNKLFGEFASQNKFLLTEILRKEWGFDGLVVTDWGAIVDRVKAVEAGLDLEMPHAGAVNDDRVSHAVEHGKLDLEAVNQSALHVTELILRSLERKPLKYNAENHRAIARKAAAQSAVLLKNDGNLLPGNKLANAAVIGAFAESPRYQGAGSSKIVPLKIDDAVEELKTLGLNVEYADGYLMESDEVDQSLLDEACRIAKGKDVVYLFAGLPDRYEAEGFDRANMDMPENHIALIEAVSQVNPNVAVILMGGSPMELPWADHVKSILLMYLGGETVGGACADLLLGIESPSGRLPESWPLQVSDNPSWEYFPGYPLTVEYREGMFVGYRYYDKAKKAVRYPFGYGLTYTQFEYSDLQISKNSVNSSDTITVSCKLKNTGKLSGREVVQLYVSAKNSVIIRPEQELKGFEKVSLKSGETAELKFVLSGSDLAYYNVAQSAWKVEGGEYEIRIGASSRDVRLSANLQVTGDADQKLPDLRSAAPAYYDLSSGIHSNDQEFQMLLGRSIPARERKKGTQHTINSTFYDIQDNWLGRKIYDTMSKQLDSAYADSPDLKQMLEKMMIDMPLRFLTLDSDNGFTTSQVEGIVDMLNGRLLRGLPKMLKKG